MKKTKIILASFMTLMSLQGFSSDNTGIGSGKAIISFEKQTDQLIYRLVYQSKAQGWVTVSFFDAAGTLVFTDRIQNENGFARPYNFRELPVGEYTIEVADGQEKITQRVFHSDNSVNEVAVASRVKVNVAALSNGQRFELSVLGERQQPVEVNIFDEDNNLIFTERVIEPGNFRKVYDLSKTNLQHFTFEIADNNQVLHSTDF